jgi:hypothetical protein
VGWNPPQANDPLARITVIGTMIHQSVPSIQNLAPRASDTVVIVKILGGVHSTFKTDSEGLQRVHQQRSAVTKLMLLIV